MGAYEQFLLKQVKPLMPVAASVLEILKEATCLQEQEKQGQPYHRFSDRSVPLFRVYPELQKRISYCALGDFCTPITDISELFLNERSQSTKVYMKRDDLSGLVQADGSRLIGGNKVRKLEFLLADAYARGYKAVMTFGCAGSNHAVATAAYAKLMGLSSISILRPQENSVIVRRNLLLQQLYGAELHEYPNQEWRTLGGACAFLRYKQLHGAYPYIIPAGGSCPLGVLGFINAAFELKEQIENGVMPAPDYIYVPFASMGTVAGLVIGLKVAGVAAQVRAVRVDELADANAAACLAIMHEAASFIQEHDPSFPALVFDEHDLQIVHDFFGPGYGLSFAPAEDAIARMAKVSGIQLDGTYSGKALAALLSDLKKPDMKDKKILFWNTFCGLDYSAELAALDYAQLSACFHRYFE